MRPQPAIKLDSFDFLLAVIGNAVSMPEEWDAVLRCHSHKRRTAQRCHLAGPLDLQFGVSEL